MPIMRNKLDCAHVEALPAVSAQRFLVALAETYALRGMATVADDRDIVRDRVGTSASGATHAPRLAAHGNRGETMAAVTCRIFVQLAYMLGGLRVRNSHILLIVTGLEGD